MQGDRDITAQARIVITPVASVDEVAISSITHPRDQGWTKRLINREINGSRDLLVSVFRMGPGQYHPLHAHPNVGELYFVLEGRCELRVGDRREWVAAGTAIYTPPNTPHSARTADEGVSILIVFPKGDWSQIEKVWHE